MKRSPCAALASASARRCDEPCKALRSPTRPKKPALTLPCVCCGCHMWAGGVQRCVFGAKQGNASVKHPCTDAAAFFAFLHAQTAVRQRITLPQRRLPRRRTRGLCTWKVRRCAALKPFAPGVALFSEAGCASGVAQRSLFSSVSDAHAAHGPCCTLPCHAAHVR